MSWLLTKFSTLPILFLIQTFAVGKAARGAARLQRPATPRHIDLLLFLLAAWGVCVSWLALDGAFTRPDFLASYPAIWLPFVPVVLVIACIALVPGTLDTIRTLIDATPAHWLTAIHALRILAIGGIIKAFNGEFSLSFAVYVGGPDLLFGLSALFVTWLAANSRIETKGLLIWNLLGALAIIPGASIVGQMGLPGILHAIEETPSVTSLFAFPMVLAPALVVPFFVMMNLFVAMRLLERKMAARRQPDRV